MTTLHVIYADGCLTALEVYCGDVKYVESFSNWKNLLDTLVKYFDCYAYIEIVSEEVWEGKFNRVVWSD